MNDPHIQVLHGDNRQVMAGMPDASIDAIVTDPPYELGFMGKKWDASGIAYQVDLWRECLRVLKPGGHLLAFGGTRTYHRMAVAIEDAGFEIRDSIHWVYGSGFPKSLDVSKAIDKAAGAERQVVGTKRGTTADPSTGRKDMPGKAVGVKQIGVDVAVTAPATDAAKQWEGWGTALKPAHEPIVLARKPLNGTMAGNVLQHGTGALNIDATRIPHGAEVDLDQKQRQQAEGTGRSVGKGYVAAILGEEIPMYKPGGRWPANIVFDKTAGQALDQQSGAVGSWSGNPARKDGTIASGKIISLGERQTRGQTYETRGGGASRFFTQADWSDDDWSFIYQAKPSKKERNAGLENNNHPTVKPITLMQHLIRLVTPPNGTILDPFAGSGTTLIAAIHENKNAIGIELQPEYIPIIQARIKHAQQTKAQQPKQTPLEFNP